MLLDIAPLRIFPFFLSFVASLPNDSLIVLNLYPHAIVVSLVSPSFPIVLNLLQSCTLFGFQLLEFSPYHIKYFSYWLGVLNIDWLQK
jgi:hypothetical protein